ncbi:DUF4326 domain-containing protein [Candidatus Methylobacter oryzae]|uniref:DUF4326 domain-containing protein n=1 Tax=Candidatus Methylobacter oryzae TaxID=2497749 RepID=A0ABY3CAZ0_9GAMM|nr:DUF4326 domain-containing protein [Candidatus Methylobacter oryzae]TRW94404.1 DUF4326 domain-containing protein [Candidatus Methylobacter oryzae]
MTPHIHFDGVGLQPLSKIFCDLNARCFVSAQPFHIVSCLRWSGSPRILNANIDDIPPDAIFVDRSSIYGNPYRLGINGDIEQVKELYIDYLLKNPSLVEDIKLNLKNKSLVCWCAPAPCDAEILIRLANDPEFRFDALLQGAAFTLDR